MGQKKPHFKQLKENMRGMTFAEKADHIWTYYKEYMLVAFILLTIVVGILMSVFMKSPKEYTCGMMSNAELTYEGYDYLTDVFLEQVLKKPDGRISISKSELTELEFTVQATHSNAENVSALLAKVEAKKIDYLLLDTYSLQYYAPENIYLTLTGVMDQQELDALQQQGMLKAIRAEDEETERIVGIDISRTDFGKDCLTTEGPVYLVFVRNTDEKDNCLKLWEHIKAWKPQQ